MKSIKCFNVTKKLVCYLENELNESEALSVKTHLDNCAYCRNELKNLQQFMQLVKNTKLISEPAEDFSSMLLLKVRRKTQQNRIIDSPIINFNQILAGLAACLILMAGILFYLNNQKPQLDIKPTNSGKYQTISRAEFRKNLDAKYEKETKYLAAKTQTMKTILAELIEEHQESNKRYSEINKMIKEHKFSDKESLTLKTHLQWITEHNRFIETAQKIINNFEKRKKEYEKMEETHNTVSFAQIEEEHEQFERELKEFHNEYNKCHKYIEMSRIQMDIINLEYIKILSKYSKT